MQHARRLFGESCISHFSIALPVITHQSAKKDAAALWRVACNVSGALWRCPRLRRAVARPRPIAHAADFLVAVLRAIACRSPGSRSLLTAGQRLQPRRWINAPEIRSTASLLWTGQCCLSHGPTLLICPATLVCLDGTCNSASLSQRYKNSYHGAIWRAQPAWMVWARRV